MEILNQEIPLRTIALRSAALIGSKSVQDGLLSILFIWLARINQSGYGLIAFGLSITMLLRSLQSMGLDQYTLRELSSTRDRTGCFLKQMITIKTIIAGGAIIIFLIFATLVKQWPLQQVAIVTILLFSQCFEGMADTFFNLFRAEGQSVNEGICRTGPNIIAFIYGAGCLYFQVDILFFSLLFLLSGTLKLSTSLYGISKLHNFSLKKRAYFSLKKNELISLFFFAAVSFTGTFYNEIQIFWIRHYNTLIDVALYRVAFDITSSICGIVAHLIIGAILFPQLVTTFTHKDKTNFQKITRKHFKRLIILGGGLALFLSVFGGQILLFIYGDKYIRAEALVPVFGTAAFFSFINNFCIYVLLAMRRERLLSLILLIPVSLSIILGPLLVADSGPMGGAISLLLCRFILSIFLIAWLHRQVRLFDIAF